MFEVQQSGSCGAHQPGGLADSSRWLKRSENHRNRIRKQLHPEGVLELKEKPLNEFWSGTPSGCVISCLT